MQLEKSFAGFTNSFDHLCREVSNSEKILRLNGCCATPLMGLEIGEYLKLALEPFRFETLGKISDAYTHMIVRAEPWTPPQIVFAWEPSSYDRYKSGLQSICTSTDVAVFVGYSFPYFNRETDGLIVSMMQSSPLKKIYVQAMPEDHAGVKERLTAMLHDRPVPVEMKHAVDLFFLPDELERPFGS